LKNDNKDTNDQEDESVQFAISSRSRRATNGISINFSISEPIPTKPNDAVQDLVTKGVAQQDDYDVVQKLFEEREIWTLASIRAHLRQPPRRLSHVLAAFAYFYTTGPWRNCYIKFGYDPRKHFESRFYQMIDYRVRQHAGFKGELKRKRQTATMIKRIKAPAKNDCAPLEEEIEESFQQRRREAIFTIDTIPPFRARHYQFVDIHIPQIQEMLQKIPSPITGATCNDKRGWLPVGFMEQCRNVLTDIAQTNMMKLCKEKNISLEDFNTTEILGTPDTGIADGNNDSTSDDDSPEDED